MKKFFVTMMVVVMLTSMVNAMAVGQHKIEYMELDEDFAFSNDPRLHVAGFEYEGDRQDLYIYVGEAFKVRVSNVEDHDAVNIDFIRTTDTIDVLIHRLTCTYEEATTNDSTLNTRFQVTFATFMMLMERHGWA